MGKKDRAKRIRAIQKRKAQRQRRRRFLNFCLILGIVLFIIVIAKACEGRKERNGTTGAEQTPAPTAAAAETPKAVKKGDWRDFYINSAFIGNSFIDGMEIYEFIDDADYFAKVGLSVNDALTETTDNGSVPVIEELNGSKSYDKIFMMFGENELGWANPQTFAEQYEKLIDKAKEYQPDAMIYLMSITPVSKEVSDQELDGASNDKIKQYNRLIKQLADNEGVVYCDIYGVVVDSNGELPKDAASDGIHFTKDYYEKCLKYISETYGGDSDSAEGIRSRPGTEN